VFHRWVTGLAIALTLVMIMMTVTLVAFGITSLERLKHTVSFYLLGEAPHFYLLEGERNGQELTLKPGELFIVSYNDEFVFTRISTDSLRGEGITVTVDSVDESQVLGKPLRGQAIVDIAMSRLATPQEGELATDLRIRIRYRGQEIATVPIVIRITPQDLLRFAAETDNISKKIAYLESLLSHREEPQVRRLLADAYLRAGRYREAVEQFDRYLKERPQDIVALSGLAKCCRALDDKNRLLQVYGEMIRVNPRDGALYVLMADVLAQLGAWDKAAQYLQRAVALLPHRADVQAKYADVLSHLGRHGEAVASYQMAVTLEPKSLQWRALLAETKMKAKDYDGAIKEYRAMLKVAPHSAAVYANLAKAYGALHDVTQEVENYRQAVRLEPRNPTLHYNLGVALERAGKWGEARKAYRRVLELSPGDPDALLRLAEGEAKAKEFKQAAQYYEQLMRKKPGNVQVITNAAAVYEDLHQLPRAAKLYEQALKLGSKDEQLYYRLFDLYEKMGRKRDAANALERFIRVRPQAKAMNTLADYYLREKRYDEAIALGKKIVARYPKQAAGYVGLARAYGQLGKTDEEIASLREALKYEREDDTIYLALGQAYEKKGLYEEALKAYQTAFELNPNSPASGKIRPLRVKIIEMKLKKQEGSGSK